MNDEQLQNNLGKIEKIIVDGNREVIKEVDQKIEAVKNELKQELGGKIEAVKNELKQEIGRVEKSLKQEIKQTYDFLSYDIKTVGDKLDVHTRLSVHA
jgi:archaellum component FlaC